MEKQQSTLCSAMWKTEAGISWIEKKNPCGENPLDVLDVIPNAT
jgi:hypothetical protein